MRYCVMREYVTAECARDVFTIMAPLIPDTDELRSFHVRPRCHRSNRAAHVCDLRLSVAICSVLAAAQ